MTDLMTILEIVFVVMLCIPLVYLVLWQIGRLREQLRREEKEEMRNARMTSPAGYRPSGRDRGNRKRKSRGRVDRSGRDRDGRRPLY